MTSVIAQSGEGIVSVISDDEPACVRCRQPILTTAVYGPDPRGAICVVCLKAELDAKELPR